jgi:hypothetical protein
MAAFRSLTADRQPLEVFKSAASRNCGDKPVDRNDKIVGNDKIDDTTLPLHLFEWSQSSQDGVETSNVRSVSELVARSVPTVRVL